LQDQLSKCEQWVPAHLEIAHLPHQVGQPYGGVFLFTQSARMARPVRYWAGGGGLELLGTLEQSTLDIHCPDGGPGGTPGLRYTHGELSAGAQRLRCSWCCVGVWSCGQPKKWLRAVHILRIGSWVARLGLPIRKAFSRQALFHKLPLMFVLVTCTGLWLDSGSIRHAQLCLELTTNQVSG
jgi:hypothetical protein